MSVYAAEWGTVPDWLMLAVTAGAAAVAVVAVVVAARARSDARRSADAAQRVADIEAGRDHDAVRSEFTLVEVVERPRTHVQMTDRIAVVRNNGHRTFRWEARVHYRVNGMGHVGAGKDWHPGQSVEFSLGPVGHEYSHLEVWLDDDRGCRCQTADGERGHWRVTFPVPPSKPTRISPARVKR